MNSKHAPPKQSWHHTQQNFRLHCSSVEATDHVFNSQPRMTAVIAQLLSALVKVRLPLQLWRSAESVLSTLSCHFERQERVREWGGGFRLPAWRQRRLARHRHRHRRLFEVQSRIVGVRSPAFRHAARWGQGPSQQADASLRRSFASREIRRDLASTRGRRPAMVNCQIKPVWW
jgi:hypothetical protein